MNFEQFSRIEERYMQAWRAAAESSAAKPGQALAQTEMEGKSQKQPNKAKSERTGTQNESAATQKLQAQNEQLRQKLRAAKDEAEALREQTKTQALQYQDQLQCSKIAFVALEQLEASNAQIRTKLERRVKWLETALQAATETTGASQAKGCDTEEQAQRQVEKLTRVIKKLVSSEEGTRGNASEMKLKLAEKEAQIEELLQENAELRFERDILAADAFDERDALEAEECAHEDASDESKGER